MRRTVLVLVLASCGADDVQVEVDAMAVDADVTDRAIDAPFPAPTSCTPTGSRLPPPPNVAPQAGTYCAEWTRVDGTVDSFPRYYDRVDILLTQSQARWYATGSAGAKEYFAEAAVENGCLVHAPFIGSGAVSGSDLIQLCWESPTVAHGTMAWCSSSLDAHWNVRLDACP